MLARVIEKVTLPQHAAILDVGGDPGFLRRWLQWSSISPEHVYVESNREVRQLRPGHTGYDRIFAIEPSGDGELNEGLARCIAGNLKPDGRYGVTLVSLDGGHEAKVAGSIERLERYALQAQQTDVSAQVRHYAETMYTTFLLGDWEKIFKTHLPDEAARVLGAIESGLFNYTLITGSATED
jgi:hypothetical protein